MMPMDKKKERIAAKAAKKF